MTATYFNQIDHTRPTTDSTPYFKGVTGYQKSVTPPGGSVAFESDNLLIGAGWTYDSASAQLTNASSFKGSRVALRSKTGYTDLADPTQGEAPFSFYRADTRGLLYKVVLGGESVTSKSFNGKPDATFFSGARTFSGADQNPPLNWLGQLQSGFSEDSQSVFDRQLSGDVHYSHFSGSRYFHEDGDEVKFYGPTRSSTRYGPWDDTLFLEDPLGGTDNNYYKIDLTGTATTSYNGGRWPQITLVGEGGSLSNVNTSYPSSGLSVEIDDDLYDGKSNGFESPNPETHFGEKRFGATWAYVTGTQVELTEKKRVFNIGPSFAYTKAAAEPTKDVKWNLSIDDDHKKLFEEVKDEIKELGGALNFHYGDTYQYSKGNSMEISVSGEEECGGFNGYGLEVMAASAIEDGGFIKERVQRAATEEDGAFIPFKEEIRGAKFHETINMIFHRDTAMKGVTVDNLATAAKTSTLVTGVLFDCKYPPTSPFVIGKIWPAINASAFTGGAYGDLKLRGVHTRVMMRPVNQIAKIFGLGDKSKSFLSLSHNEGHVSLSQQKTTLSAQVNDLKVRMNKARADNNIIDQVNDINNEAKAMLTEVEASMTRTQTKANEAHTTAVNATNASSRTKLEMSSIHTGVFHMRT